MPDDIFFYRNPVSQTGYKLVTPVWAWSGGLRLDQRLDPEPSIMVNDIYGITEVSPSKTLPSNLFLIFSELEETGQAILDFANKYGLLGIAIEASTDEHKSGSGYLPIPVEPLSEWYAEIREIRNVVRVMQLYLKMNRKELRKIIHWEAGSNDDVSVKIELDTGSSLIMSNYIRQEKKLFGACEPNSVDLPALRYIQKRINYGYEQHVNLKMIFEKNYSALVHQVTTEKLIGYMWIQLARTFDGGRPYRNCNFCRTPFTTERQRGEPRKYCSNACRTKAWRKRKASSL